MTGLFASSEGRTVQTGCAEPSRRPESPTPSILLRVSTLLTLFRAFNTSETSSLDHPDPSEGFNTPDLFRLHTSNPSASLNTQSVPRALRRSTI